MNSTLFALREKLLAATGSTYHEPMTGTEKRCVSTP